MAADPPGLTVCDAPTALATIAWLWEPTSSLRDGERRYLAAVSNDEPDARCREVTLAIRVIWESGRAFSRIHPWLARGERALHDQHASPVCRLVAGILLLNATVLGGHDVARALAYRTDLHVLLDLAPWAELAELAAAAEAPLLAMCGEQAEARARLLAASLPRPRLGPAGISTLCLAAAEALVCSIDGGTPRLLDRLEALFEPAADALPLHLRLTGLAHRMLWAARLQDVAAVERAACAMRALCVARQMTFHDGYMGYALGVAELRAGWASAAEVHAAQVRRAAAAAGCTTLQAFAWLLQGQAQADTGQAAEAAQTLDACVAFAQVAGLAAIERTARAERHTLCSIASACHATGSDGLRDTSANPPPAPAQGPGATALPLWHRPRQLAPAPSAAMPAAVWAPDDTQVLRIRTFGGFEFQAAGPVGLVDIGPKGQRPAQLLMLLVAMGGREVSADVLCDALWPDADAQQARRSLKTLVWRLRRAVDTTLGRPVPWLTVRLGRVSLERRCCWVDALAFLDAAPGLLASQDQALRILALHAGDFLPTEDAPAVRRMRARLRTHYIAMAEAATRLVLDSGDTPAPDWADMLVRARSMGDESGLAHLLLMELHLRAGQPILALTDHLAAEQLGAQLTPGAARELAQLRAQASSRLRDWAAEPADGR